MPAYIDVPAYIALSVKQFLTDYTHCYTETYSIFTRFGTMVSSFPKLKSVLKRTNFKLVDAVDAF